MEKKEPCPGTYHYPELAQRVERDKKKTWLITYCSKCKFNYDIEEYHGKVSDVNINMDGFPPQNYQAPKRNWPHA